MMIFCDFDDTLFNKNAFSEGYKNAQSFHGLQEVQVEKIFAKFSSTNPILINIFSNVAFAAIAKDIYNCNEQVLKEKLDQLFEDQAKNWIFNDTIQFLEKYQRDELAVVTFGDTDFQEKKMKDSGTKKYFSYREVTSGIKAPLIQKLIFDNNLSGPFFFLDDKPEHFIDVKKLPTEIMTILVNHKETGKVAQSNQSCDHVVTSLMDAARIIDTHSVRNK